MLHRLSHVATSIKINQKNVTSPVVTNAALHVDGPFRHFLQSLQTSNAPPPPRQNNILTTIARSPNNTQHSTSPLCVNQEQSVTQVLPIAQSPHLLLFPNQSKSSRLWLRFKIIQVWLTLSHQSMQMSAADHDMYNQTRQHFLFCKNRRQQSFTQSSHRKRLHSTKSFWAQPFRGASMLNACDQTTNKNSQNHSEQQNPRHRTTPIPLWATNAQQAQPPPLMYQNQATLCGLFLRCQGQHQCQQRCQLLL